MSLTPDQYQQVMDLVREVVVDPDSLSIIYEGLDLPEGQVGFQLHWNLTEPGHTAVYPTASYTPTTFLLQMMTYESLLKVRESIWAQQVAAGQSDHPVLLGFHSPYEEIFQDWQTEAIANLTFDSSVVSLSETGAVELGPAEPAAEVHG